MPSSTDAAKSERPRPDRLSRMNGTMTTRPKNPYTTEGMPAKSSTPGLSRAATLACANRDRKMAHKSPMGTPIRRAPAVT